MTDLKVEDVVWMQTVEGPVEIELTEEERNIGQLILPRLENLYRRWQSAMEAGERRGHYPTPFSHFAIAQPICRYAYELPNDSYHPGIVYAVIATSRSYFVSDYLIELAAQNGHLVVESVRDDWSM